ncbi:signal peptidase I [bacterium 210820-DFI.6.37]|nr:signal peptidase I [bacterium 210820-DFI.6.37]
MKNNDLNVFEIMEDSEAKPGQEQSAPDPVFREKIKQAVLGQDERRVGSGALETEPPKKEKSVIRESLKRGWKSLAIEAGIAILAVLLIFNFVIQVSRVSGDSMKPNFYDGDRIVIFRLDRDFEPGDVIVFRTAGGEKLIKRIIAAEGDTVNISAAGGLSINGSAAEETNIYAETAITDQSVQYPVTVEEDSYFVLGDNRSNSKDSRTAEIGLVKKEDIIGRVILDIRGV